MHLKQWLLSIFLQVDILYVNNQESLIPKPMFSSFINIYQTGTQTTEKIYNLKVGFEVAGEMAQQGCHEKELNGIEKTYLEITRG
ncbi:hypothetical protein H671_5g14778 [Cricetulus griseus]|uniref:Uncharacterized protein n=1 Tax=Cricetulus griseus TaxID=10029 RepID=A0A061I5T2_CRIGR|nr:hypothetical protein H671_5g14778 [Cricetulus griseus]